MGASIQERRGRHQLRLTHRLLQRPFFHTFDTVDEARSYRDQLLALLERGIVPAELLADAPRGDDPTVAELIRAYLRGAPVTDSDSALLGQVLGEVVGVRWSGLTFGWATSYVAALKKRRLAPGTIRKRVGVLARVVDWHIRLRTPPGQVPQANALRLLPDGYSVYTRTEADEIQAAGDVVPRDVQRDRRLSAAEETRILAALAGEKRPDRERALQPDPEFTMVFHLIVCTGLRLREAYRLRVDQVDLKRGVIAVEGSKGKRGQLRPRTVPITPELEQLLREYLRGRVGRLFSFWDGTPAGLRRATSRLSTRFAVLFNYAKVPDFTEHDLRHEATCRWVERRARTGGWALSDTEICRIMGWKDPRMMLRYASLRGEDLAARLR